MTSNYNHSSRQGQVTSTIHDGEFKEHTSQQSVFSPQHSEMTTQNCARTAARCSKVQETDFRQPRGATLTSKSAHHFKEAVTPN